MRKLSNEVNNVVKQIFSKKGKTFIIILQNWSQIVDNKFNQHTCPLNISYRMHKNEEIATLHVMAANNTISFELNFYKTLIIDKINLLCGFKAIHQINIKIIPE